jgi:hypothetical protein
LLAEKHRSWDLSLPRNSAAPLPSYSAADQITGTAISVDGGWTAQ